MADQINTELNIQLNLEEQIRQATRLSAQLTQMIKGIEGLNELPKVAGKNFTALGEQMKAVQNVLKQFSQGTVQSSLFRAAGTAARNEIKGQPDNLRLQIVRDELSLQKQLASVGEKIVADMRVRAKVAQGINDIETLNYKRQQELIVLGKAGIGTSEKAVAARADGLKRINDLEAQIALKQKEIVAQRQLETAQQKEQDKLRKQALIDEGKIAAEKAKQLKTPTFRTQQEYLDARKNGTVTAGGTAIAPSGDVVTQIQRRSMADLLVVQTKLLFNYQLIGAALGTIRYSVQYVRELDQAFHQLQAIGAITENQMALLRDSILDVGRNSRFTAVEVAEAAVVLAQAGLSSDQIKNSISAITLLATAAGTDLKQAVDVVTSVMNVFNFQSNQTIQVANLLTSALNESKLSISQLGLAIQYASNVAADSNIAFGEMIASFGVLADAGIRSGSTIGTGYRQLLNDLQAPSEKLQTKLFALGLSMDDINLRSKGLAGVIRTLKDAGFSTADAFETLEVRAVSTYSALSKGIDLLELTEQKYQLSQAAIKANEIQMRSLDSALKQLQSSLGAIAYDISNDLVGAISLTAKSVTELVNSLGPFKDALRVIADVVAVIALGSFVKWIASITGVTGAIVALVKFGAPVVLWIANLAAGIALAVSAAVGLGTTLLGLVTGFAVVAAAAAALYYGFKALIGSAEEINNVIDKNNEKIAEAKTEFDKYKDRSIQLAKFIQELRDKHQLLSTDTDALTTKILEAKNAFDGLGTTVISVADSYEVLLAKMIELKQETYRGQIQAAGVQALILSNANIDYGQQLQSKAAELKKTGKNIDVSSFPKNVQQQLGTVLTTGQKENRGVDENISLINAARVLNDLRSQVTDEKQLKLYDAVIKNIADQGKLVSEIEVNKRNLIGAERGQQAASFDLKASGVVSFVQSTLTSLTDKDKETLRGTDTAAGLKSVKDNYDTRIAGLEKALQLTDKYIGIPAQSQEKAALETQLADLRRDRDKLNESYIKLQANESERRVEIIKASLEDYKIQARTVSRTESEALKNKFANERKAQAQSEIAAARGEFQKPDYLNTIGLGGLTDPDKKKQQIDLRMDEAKDRITKEAQNDIDAFNTQISERLGKFSKAVTDDLLPAAERLKNAFEDLNNATKQAIAFAELPSRIKQAENEALDIGANKFNVTDAERYFAQRDLEKLQAAASIIKLDALRTKGGQLPGVVAGLEAEKARLEALAAQSGGTATELAGTATGKRNNEEFKRLQTQYKSVVNTLQDANNQMVELQVETAKAAAEAKALNDELESKSTGEVFSLSLNKYLDETTRFRQSNAQLGRDFEKLFGDIDSAFSATVKNIVTGNGSMADSFKNLAKSVVESMLDIAVQRTSASLFDTLFGKGGGSLLGSAIGAIFGSATGGTAGEAGYAPGAVTSTDLKPFASGGIVTGGIPNRDSVGTMLMPGEGVLNKRAVDMLGEGTVNALNASAGRIASQGAPAQVSQGQQDGGTKLVNFYLVDERRSVPSVGPNDVVAIVGDDISRGGSLRKLVKSVVM